MAAGCFSLPASTEGMKSEFERRIRALQRPYDYAA
jgi:hypothetical protein